MQLRFISSFRLRVGQARTSNARSETEAKAEISLVQRHFDNMTLSQPTYCQLLQGKELSKLRIETCS
jgi:hypothetical protein